MVKISKKTLRRMFSFFILTVIFSSSLVGCFVTNNKDKDKKDTSLPPVVVEYPAYSYDDTKDYSVKVPEGIDIKRTFYSDFSSGLSDEHWSVVNYGWGEGNNGMGTENVMYSTNSQNVEAAGATNGMVIIRSQGAYNENPLHRKRGGAIITRDSFGAGLYEVRMKIVPRMGACTAAWTYYNGPQREQYSEIDIEFPVNNGFLQGSYTTYKWFESFPSDLDNTNYIVDNEFPFNDGKWHNYAFEWRTDPEEIVNWYIDGKLVATSKTSVPEYGAQYWIGNWFPPNWAGNSDFDTAYMYVDYVRITEYEEPNGIITPVNVGGAGSTNLAVNLGDRPIPVNDYIANGRFKTIGTAGENSALGWQVAGNVNRVTEGSSAYLQFEGNAEATQIITAVYKGYKFKLDVDAVVEAGNGKLNINVEFLNGSVSIGKAQTLVIDPDTQDLKSFVITVPPGKSASFDPNTIRIRIASESGVTARLNALSMFLIN